MKTSTYSRRSQTVSTVKKSQARVLAACWRRKARQLGRSRCGAGGTPARASTLRTSVADTLTPRLRSSPTMRKYPQLLFSRASRRISSRTYRATGGRPGRRCGYVQRQATSRRCQRNSVSGLTMKRARERRGSTRLSAASRKRSWGSKRGRPTCRQDRQLVTQHEDLDFLRAVAARDQHHQLKQPAGEDVQERHKQGQLQQAGASTLPRRQPPVAPSSPTGCVSALTHRLRLCTPRGRGTRGGRCRPSAPCARSHSAPAPASG
jgi:hypothetical protein